MQLTEGSRERLQIRGDRARALFGRAADDVEVLRRDAQPLVTRVGERNGLLGMADGAVAGDPFQNRGDESRRRIRRAYGVIGSGERCGEQQSGEEKTSQR